MGASSKPGTVCAITTPPGDRVERAVVPRERSQRPLVEDAPAGRVPPRSPHGSRARSRRRPRCAPPGRPPVGPRREHPAAGRRRAAPRRHPWTRAAPDRRCMSIVSRTLVVPPTISGAAIIASRMRVSGRRRAGARVASAAVVRIGQQHVGARHLDEREGVGRQAAVVHGRPQPPGRRPEQPRDGRPHRAWLGCSGSA